MTSSRRGQPPLSVRLPSFPNGSFPDLPPISALFLIDFDVRAGYTISWKRAEPGIELEGLVEYKSLPSGLHTVHEDLIYFVHERDHAGLSAFINVPCEEEEARNARMIAVGILVPLSEGRLGRAWRHASALKDIAAEIAQDRNRINLLEAYWTKHTAAPSDDTEEDGAPAETPLEPPLLDSQKERLRQGHSRKRSTSDGAALLPPGHRLSPYHPAWSLNALIDTFGPLIFPIYRAALLRKRILISCHAPVHEMCNFVYGISILSNIPQAVTEILDPSVSSHRLRPLFTIGVHDIPFLLDDLEAAKKRNETGDAQDVTSDAGTGWIACTTDSILTIKDDLWDMLITMPPAHASDAKKKVWPTVECPRGTPVKATQRDLRRFRALKTGLARHGAAAGGASQPRTAGRSPSMTSGSIRLATPGDDVDVGSDDSIDEVVEPITWTALAYNGFLWWASAGEQAHSEEQEEAAADAALLADLGPSPHTPAGVSLSSANTPKTPGGGAGGMSDSVGSLHRRSGGSATVAEDEDEAKTELAIIAYFHRLTTQILSVVADVVESAEPGDEAYESYTDEEDGDDEPRARAGVASAEEEEAVDEEGEDVPLNGGSGDDDLQGEELEQVRVASHALETMGLDVWNRHDAEFVQELVARYFAREARIEGKGVEVCGVRIC